MVIYREVKHLYRHPDIHRELMAISVCHECIRGRFARHGALLPDPRGFCVMVIAIEPPKMGTSSLTISIAIVVQAVGPCIIVTIWCCRKPCNGSTAFIWTSSCHSLKGLRQRQIAVAIQATGVHMLSLVLEICGTIYGCQVYWSKGLAVYYNIWMCMACR